MKQALILGLAFAANAMTADQVDNELMVAPSGGKFSDLAKFPGRMGRLMFDEQADDELFVAPIDRISHDLAQRIHGKFMFDEVVDDELVAMKKKPFEESKGGMPFLFRPRMKPQRAEEMSSGPYYKAADDDELFVAPQGKLADLAKKYPGMIMFDEQADDEFIVMNIPREKFKTEEEWKRYLMSRSEEVADDELLIRPILNADDDEFIAMLLPRGHFKTEEEYQKYVAKMRFSRDDEELFVAPEGKLGELAKKYPGRIMFDEQADDELLIRPILNADDDEFIVMLLPREHFKTEEEYQKYVAKMRFHRDDEELFVAPEGKLGELAKKFPGRIMFDEQADDELIVMNIPREKFKTEEEWKRYLMSRSEEVADDELLIRPIVQADDDEFIVMLLPREHFKTEEEYQKYVAKMRFHRDDEELFVAPEGKLGELAKKFPGRIMFDEQADEELYYQYHPLEQYRNYQEWLKTTKKVADDELLVRPVVPHIAAADEFIVMNIPREKFKTEEEWKRYLMSRSEEVADDELAYLGNLIRHAENEKLVPLHRAEKAQVKSELPKKQRKFRPAADETAFLA